MELLETLRAKNPALPFDSVLSPAFRPFGRVVPFDAAALMAACPQAAPMPPSGVRYEPSLPALEALPDFARVQNALRGQGACQIGCCWGYNTRLGCFEYHRASEHLIAVSDVVLLVAPLQAMEGFTLPAGQVRAFHVPQGTTVELYATTLHYAPCQTADTGFRAIIILPRGTNHPLTSPRPETGDGPLLWAQDKWLIAHPGNAAVANGAYPGLLGEDYDIVT